MTRSQRISVIIPARDEEERIGPLVHSVMDQCPAGADLEVLVMDDGSCDATQAAARKAGATVISTAEPGRPGNPARARNIGASKSSGDALVFLDADCDPIDGWLRHLMRAHGRGEICVGGSLGLPPGLSFSARCDYYCGWYNAAPELPGGYVSNHPPGNLSVDRQAFLDTCGFSEEQPVAYAHEELAWQGDLLRSGHRILFEPRAEVWHWNRPGIGNLMRRNYRWGYSSIQAKAAAGNARFAALYRHPVPLIAVALPIGLASAVYILWRWVRARRFEPFLMLPFIVLARLFWAAGMAIGGCRWLAGKGSSGEEYRPIWE